MNLMLRRRDRNVLLDYKWLFVRYLGDKWLPAMHRRIVRIEKRNFPTRHRQFILPRSMLWIQEQPLAGDDVQVGHRLILPWSHQVHIEHFSMISRWTIFDWLTQSGVDVADDCPSSSSSSNVPDLLKTTVERWNSVDVCDRFVRFQCDCLLVDIPRSFRQSLSQSIEHVLRKPLNVDLNDHDKS